VLQATLTLPGIAGIVLTIGMAVDANVLIFERIREEMRAGRGPVTAVDAGYRRAMKTIFDSNLTTLIAALLLFQFGSGPIKGFAVTLSLGLITSMFSAIMVTRLIVVAWLRSRRPQALAL
jgi:preprotein translocase subunit SecD